MVSMQRAASQLQPLLTLCPAHLRLGVAPEGSILLHADHLIIVVPRLVALRRLRVRPALAQAHGRRRQVEVAALLRALNNKKVNGQMLLQGCSLQLI